MLYFDQKYLYSKFNVYVDNDKREAWSPCDSTYYTCVKRCVDRALYGPVLEFIAKPSHTEASVLCKVFGNIRTIFTKLVRDFIA